MICALSALVIAFSSVAQTQTTITFKSLLEEMSDLKQISQLPSPRYKQLQASSYDRTQTDPNDAKTWFGNADWGGYIRKEERIGKTEWVLMEHNGPGAITRFWIPLLPERDKAIIRFYFDGADKPAIEVNYNDLLRGKGLFKAPFAFIAWPDPAPQTGVAGDLYFPIPFAKSCKVTLSEEAYYFAINYRAYTKGTAVETFNVQQVEPRTADYIASIAEAISLKFEPTWNRRHKPSASEKDPGGTRAATTPPIQPGKSFSLDLPSGAREIEYLHILEPTDVSPQVLRSTIIELTFDGNRTVWCPIGDFFGCGVSLRGVWDRFREVRGDGVMLCVWPMPYKKSARLRLINLSNESPSFNLQVRTIKRKWDSQSLYFHTTWRHQYPLSTRPYSDWNYVTLQGQGQYVGDTLTVMNPTSAWYGEGDERVYVDGEKFPSHLGTGTEDYYGYAWGMASEWSSPFISMPRRDRETRDNWSGYTTTSRVRMLDAIPFEKSLKLDMEIWHWAACNVEYSVACFWYARPGATSNRPPAPTEAAKPLPEPQGKIKDAFECESMSVISKSEGVIAEEQGAGLTEGAWSHGNQLYVQNDKVGGFVELRFTAPQSGKRHVFLYATKSWDYGIVRFSVNGSVAKEIDLWNATAIATGPVDLGVYELKRGDNRLRAEVVGTNPSSKGSRFFFGLDCIVIKPAK